VVAVHDFAAARESLVSRFGFHDAPLAGPVVPGVGAVVAGGVTIVLVGAEASPAVERYVVQHGDGVQHIALEVLNAGYARACLAATGAPLLTDVVQLGFISRTGHRVGIGSATVLALFDRLSPS
jgi:4-hydroxyphenylpyruvate dioxygenase-like putative hemolysin